MHETISKNVAANGAGGREPNVLAFLERIDRRLAVLEEAIARVEAVERAIPGAIATVTDTVDDVAARMQEKGISIDERLSTVVDVAERLTSPEALAAVSALLDKLEIVQHLLDSNVLAESTVDVVGKAGDALVAARAEPPRELGFLGVARAMSDDDVRRATGFLVRVAQLFGRSLEDTPQRSAPRLVEGGSS